MKSFVADETLATCPLCECMTMSRVYDPDVVRCKACHTLFRNPRPSQAQIASSYNNGATYEDWHLRSEYFDILWHRRAALVRKQRTQGSLLDIGVGDGGFLKAAIGLGFKGEGTELSLTGAGLAAKRGLQVHLGQLTEIDFGNRTFDIITIWHVLEHVPNPGAVMRKVHGLLAPEGLLFIAVPNEDHTIWKNRIRGRWRSSPFENLQWGSEIHLTHFQPRTLQRFLRANGFKIRSFEVDDFYSDRRTLKQLKTAVYQFLGGCLGWHCAAAMLVVCEHAHSHSIGGHS